MDLTYEIKNWNQGKSIIVGIDEVGRGCIAGPVVAAAVSFSPKHNCISGINDSKLLSPKKRQYLAEKIQESADFIKIGICPVETIDTCGILQATSQAMLQAIASIHPTLIFVDGPLTLGLQNPTYQLETVVHGDRLVYSIAAASIIAKVYRDNLMANLHQQYPHYSWNQNKGYGTKAHYEAIKTHGLTVHHRKTFITIP